MNGGRIGTLTLEPLRWNPYVGTLTLEPYVGTLQAKESPVLPVPVRLYYY